LNLLLDTCTFLWLILGNSELSSRARDRIRDPDNDVYLSSVSTWEMALKCGIGRLHLPEPVDRFVIGMRERHEICSLEPAEEATLQVTKLPDLHHDPFDRMLVCQAIVHGLTLITPDRLIQQYPVRTDW
jgi:PIN domain nuclease of toxin-antitoxin system